MRPLIPFLALFIIACMPRGYAEDPYTKADDTWISISGTVVSPDADSFVLDYGDGLVTVEMDDWDWYGDAYGILDGDKVTVHGRVDDDLYETTTIEASSVYVESLGSYFYANAADEEDYTYSYVTTTPIVIGEMNIRGKVTDVDQWEDEFTVDTGLRKIRVDVSELAYDPLDDHGYQKIREGDRVSVNGPMDKDLFDTREIEADWVITLSKDESKSDS